ncbi:MAG TPA: glycogen/starch/alpha-glucan phosphorylase, partial [Polyangiaceae bacterium]|nr:glycogen/starch/alpha-glucan phosphorylase [Polyangiaceae bacterium]
KAAAGYQMAKLHIKLINDVAEIINNDPQVQGQLRVVFVPNYGVTLAETIIPAADLSVQISLAGREASGTSNMKFAMNGALTIGTLDGANVEIRDEVGPENFFLFGMDVSEVERVRATGYQPQRFIDASPRLAEAVELLASGFFSLGDPGRFAAVVHSLRHDDPFMVCADFDAYHQAHEEAAAVYQDRRAWTRRALFNIAGSARFSSDETIRAYSRDIWRLEPTPVDMTRPFELEQGSSVSLRSV